jgi:Protein of unknown function with PCYCGC motif
MLRKILIGGVICGFAFLGHDPSVLRAQNSSAQTSSSSTSGQTAPTSANHKADIPAYHPGAPKGPLPNTLDPQQFSDTQTRNVYALAGKIKPILYQEPCYCRCDKEVGHKSLLDCFVDYHGAHCLLCKKEAVFTYTESQQGKTAAEIRKEIMDGKWKDVDLSKYDDPLTPAN